MIKLFSNNYIFTKTQKGLYPFTSKIREINKSKEDFNKKIRKKL